MVQGCAQGMASNGEQTQKMCVLCKSSQQDRLKAQQATAPPPSAENRRELGLLCLQKKSTSGMGRSSPDGSSKETAESS